MKKLLILALLIAPFIVLGQGNKVKGTVVAFQKFPLENVTVTSKKNKTQTTTNANGEFEIEVAKNDVLKFQANGFNTYNMKLNDSESSKPVKANLVYTNRPDDFEVAVGHGHIKKEHLTYAIDHLMLNNNDYSTFTNIYDLIQAKAAGVRVMQEGGQKIFVIRGINSINSSSAALLVVDGVVVSDIGFLNIHDVANIQILKDGSAAIYGSRGANGVIMISTKRGNN